MLVVLRLLPAAACLPRLADLPILERRKLMSSSVSMAIDLSSSVLAGPSAAFSLGAFSLGAMSVQELNCLGACTVAQRNPLLCMPHSLVSVTYAQHRWIGTTVWQVHTHVCPCSASVLVCKLGQHSFMHLTMSHSGSFVLVAAGVTSCK